MPPKRKAAAAKKAAGGKAKKAKVEPEEVEPEEVEESAAPATVKDAIAHLKTVDKGKKVARKQDALCRLSGQVVDDYDCMLNQTNIGNNNNKYYIIQVLECGGKYYSWNRWGRVGEPGRNALKGPTNKAAAVKDFEKKYQDKTKNNWENRDSFVAVPGKYTLLEMGGDASEDEESDVKEKIAKLDRLDGVVKNITTEPSKLNKDTQQLIQLIFNNDMFQDAMKEMELDVKKMPLGKLSKSQIAKGFEVLEEMEEVVNKKKKGNLTELSSKFYTLIPHSFGRQRPPTISDQESIQKKMDMLMVLADIELAQALKKDTEIIETKSEVHPHPLDVNYGLLQCDLELLSKSSKDYKIIENYMTATESSYRKIKMLNVWTVGRHTESERFNAHNKLDNRKLLWHGTNVAVVAAILKSGLRIMPHSGGRVGKGIYFASENGKSASYVSCAQGGIGIMFLNEVALGKEHHITMDDGTLTAPPNGFDSIIAKGRTEPDPKLDAAITLDGKKVVVPQGKPTSQPAFSTSNFSQSEYLVYKESQCRIRYLLQLQF